MPKRTDKPAAGEMKEYQYGELLVRIRAYIDDTYGGVAKFLSHEDFKKCGFKGTKADGDKMYIYLSLPREEDSRRIKSFPVVAKLYKGLLGIELKNDIKVLRVQTIRADQAKIEQLPVSAKA